MDCEADSQPYWIGPTCRMSCATNGSRVFADYVPDFDATVVAKAGDERGGRREQRHEPRVGERAEQARLAAWLNAPVRERARALEQQGARATASCGEEHGRRGGGKRDERRDDDRLLVAHPHAIECLLQPRNVTEIYLDDTFSNHILTCNMYI